MQFRWKMKKLFQPKSNKMLFLVASLATLLVVALASVSCFLSGVGQASAPPSSNKKTLQVATTTKAKNKPSTSSKESAPSSQAVAPPELVMEAPNTTQEQSVPASSEEQTPSQADIQAQNEARKSAQEKQEAENQQTAQSLKEEYESKGYTVDVVHQ